MSRYNKCKNLTYNNACVSYILKINEICLDN